MSTDQATDTPRQVPAVGAPLDRRVRPRAAFEAWISGPPYERDIERFGEGSAWPGNYRDIVVDLAWNAWLDAMTMTREPLAPEVIEAAAAEAFGYEGGLQEVNLSDLLHFARTLEQRHGIGA